jgi:hypothetical protein
MVAKPLLSIAMTALVAMEALEKEQAHDEQ